MRFLLLFLTALVLISTTAPVAQAAPASATTAGFAYFPETGHNIGPQGR
jgi:hypothetical protein